MPNHKDVEWLLGRRFVADFTVLRVDSDADRTVTLKMRNQKGTFKISMEELQNVIERGFVMEAGEDLPRATLKVTTKH